jgi:hypothetical protein
MECRLTGETEVLGENLPQSHFCPSQNPTWPDPGLNTGRRCGKPATNRLSYGAAITGILVGWTPGVWFPVGQENFLPSTASRPILYAYSPMQWALGKFFKR